MAKKQFWILVDGETTIKDKVADFGAAVVDRTGKIHAQCGVMVAGIFGEQDLFYDRNSSGIWSRASVNRRTEHYNQMIENGSRKLASIAAINRWLEKAAGKYSPVLSAYNLAFDLSKCRNTGIDLNMFNSSFCLWHAAAGNICVTKGYRQFVMDNHLFNTPTAKRNMTFRTDAEAVASYLNGSILEEPHTALEDIRDFEIPILVRVLKKRNWKDNLLAYNWRSFQVKKHFKAA